MLAGAHAIDITPTTFPVIINGEMTEATAMEVVDPLYARCLVLDDGSTQIAIVIIDSCMIPRPLIDEAKRLAQAATGIPVERMLIAATHVHSCPSVCGLLGSGVDEPYAAMLPGRIAQAIEAAWKSRASARIGWATGNDSKNVFCRRFLMKPGTAATNPFGGTRNDRAEMNPGHLNPNAIERTGPADTEVVVVSVEARDGRPIALLANYSTHYAGAPAVSAGYFGVFSRRVAEMLGAEDVTPPLVAMLSNGTSGDANCSDYAHPPREFDRFTVGEDVAKAAFTAVETIRYFDWVPLVMEEKRLTLDVRMPSKKDVTAARKTLAALEGRRPRTIPEVYANETVRLSQLPPTRELKLQAIRIGDLGIAAMPNEVFGSTGLEIKQKSPLEPTFSIALANGCEGYIPPPEQHALGGYTTWRARSSCLEIEAEPKIKAAILALLEEVARRRADEKSTPSPDAEAP